MKQWYEELFENYSTKYDSEDFTTGTVNDAAFIENEIRFNKKIKILDIGCGTGRHSIELARRGYNVTGIDLSKNMLTRAKEKAKDAGVTVKFIKRDARRLKFENEFGLALMLCEGGFPLMETDEMNYEILKGAAASLKKGGIFIFTTLNGLFPLFHSVKDFINSNSTTETRTDKNSFDLMTFRDYSDYTVNDDCGVERTLKCNERYYVPSEITWLLKSLGFKTIEILGCEIGSWHRDKKLSTEDYEMLVIAKK